MVKKIFPIYPLKTSNPSTLSDELLSAGSFHSLSTSMLSSTIQRVSSIALASIILGLN